MAPQGIHPENEDAKTPASARTGAETAELIAECAAALFADKGYSATSIREITEAAKVTKPTLYYHFGSKDGLIRHLIEGTLQNHTKNLEDMTVRSDHEQALVDLAIKQLEFCEAHPTTVTLLVRLDVQRPPNLGINLEEAQVQNHLLLESFFSSGIKAGVFRGDAQFLAMTFVGMMISHLMARVTFPDTDFGPAVPTARALVSLLLDGARAPSPETT